MTPSLIIQGWENKIDFRIIPEEYQHLMEYLSQCIANHKGEEREILGLHKKTSGFAPGNFIGMVWLGEDENRGVLRVDSKFEDMDYIAMYAECLKHPKIGRRTVECLKFWTEQDPIDTNKHDDVVILIVIAYLHELNELCRRHMRRHFIRERQNFVGKMKGKIIVSENIRRNTIYARPDRIYCEFQSVSNDILENQILRTALERASRYLTEYSGNKNELDMLPQWIRASRAALHDVSTRHVKPGDFIAARKRGAFAFYASSLALAKAVLQQLGPNPKTEIIQTQTPPFALNSAELFERYAEMKLLETYEELLPGKNTNIHDAGDFNVTVRPDFYVPREQTPRIIDAKYKDIKLTDIEISDNNEERKPSRDDIYQVVAYSRHQGLLRKMNCDDSDSIELGLAYPYVDESEESVISRKQTRAFMSPLTVYGIPCPTKNNEIK